MKHSDLGNLLRISRCFETYRRQQLKEVDLYPALQLFVSHICRHPGSNQEELADALCVDKTTAAHHLTVLEERGYVFRRTDERDGRCRRVFPTQRALTLYPRLCELFGAFYDGLVQGLSAEEKDAVSRLGEHLFRNAKGMTQTRG